MRSPQSFLFLLLCLIFVQFEGSTCIKPSSSLSLSSSTIAVQFGDNISPVVVDFITSLLTNTTNNNIQVYSADIFLNASTYSTVLSFGQTKTRQVIIPQNDLDELGSEGYIIRSLLIEEVIYLIGDGNKIVPDVFNNNQDISNGAHYSAFKMMEILGFPFFHPLRIVVPPQLSNFTVPLNITEKPYWPIRGWHYHTQHLLELTDMFNGFGLNGTDDQEGWESFLPYYQSFLFWLVANHQNRLEWILLCSDDWADFCNSTTRLDRQLVLTKMARAVGVASGADVPIAEEQQHAWRMITNFTDPQSEIEQLQDRIDWLVSAGFDFISTENGFSEFTHPNDISMVGWMNASVSYLAEKYNKKMYIKCHCSSGQIANDYVSPWTGQKLNFNFLPIMADSRLGVYPHTVQSYRFDDPAPTYGNDNFEYMFEFLINVSGSREVVYYGETDYWVNYDIDVPLFYPLYGDSRIYDLRKIALAQENSTSKMQGQMNFDSGWEWGSWIQDTLTARAVWNPRLDIDNQADALAQALEPITSIFGQNGPEISGTLQQLISYQRQYMVLGLVNGTAPKNITRFNGQAYLQGWDTWSEVGALGGDTSTQPTKFSFLDVRDPFHNSRYWNEIEPLLAEMDKSFGEIADKLESFRNQVPTWTLDLYDDIVDSSRMLAVRAAHVHALYDYAAGYLRNSTWRADRLEVAQMSMITAQKVIANRETHYRISPHVVAGWRANPTCYSYGYLWTVHSNYYFWRDYAQATSPLETLSPCFMNIINPINVGFGEGILYNVTEIAYKYFEKYKWTDFFSECLVSPSSEPEYGSV